MRSDMIMPKEGETEFTVLNHYDEMKRVSTRTHRYKHYKSKLPDYQNID